MNWRGVFPAITTPFEATLAVDEAALGTHVEWMLASGCAGIVPLGSLGEGNTLSFAEKLRVLDVAREALAGRASLVPGIAALSTAEAVALVQEAERRGCAGAMVLPPYVYRGDARETLAHFDAVLEATALPCMLYNNPVAYGTDVTPEQIAELAARHANLNAVKESSADIRRFAALRTLLGERLALFAGVDDLIVEAIDAGASGWIAGLVNAFPSESVRLFALGERGDRAAARALYEWFLPLLRLDTIPKFVQAIKLVQAEVGRGSERVRPPRLELEGEERARVLTIVRESVLAQTV
jgi:4-hydroxy-tetrahydrodipicolinate synthase